jgi:hypothetical protein
MTLPRSGAISRCHGARRGSARLPCRAPAAAGRRRCTRRRQRPARPPRLPAPPPSTFPPPPPPPQVLQQYLKIEGVAVKYIGPGQNDSQAAAVRADNPVPPDVPLYYFEVLVVNKGAEGYIGGRDCLGSEAERETPCARTKRRQTGAGAVVAVSSTALRQQSPSARPPSPLPTAWRPRLPPRPRPPPPHVRAPLPLSGIGFSTDDVKADRLPGWEPHSYGYHGDDGCAFHGSGQGREYGPKYGQVHGAGGLGAGAVDSAAAGGWRRLCVVKELARVWPQPRHGACVARRRYGRRRRPSGNQRPLPFCPSSGRHHRRAAGPRDGDHPLLQKRRRPWRRVPQRDRGAALPDRGPAHAAGGAARKLWRERQRELLGRPPGDARGVCQGRARPGSRREATADGQRRQRRACALAAAAGARLRVPAAPSLLAVGGGTCEGRVWRRPAGRRRRQRRRRRGDARGDRRRRGYHNVGAGGQPVKHGGGGADSKQQERRRPRPARGQWRRQWRRSRGRCGYGSGAVA